MANKSRTVLSPEFRMSYPSVIVAKEFKDKGKPSGKFFYQTETILTEDSLKKFRVLRDGVLVEVDIQQLLAELAREAWGDEKNPETGAPLTVKEMFAGPLAKGWPLRKGDVVAEKLKAEGKNGDHYRGMRVMAIKANKTDKALPPALGFADANGFKPLDRLSPTDMQRAQMMFAGGNYAVAELNIVAQDVSGLKYLTPYLNSITYTREGVKLGNQGGQLMSRFEGIKGGASDHNPTAGMDDDEIPF